MKKFVTATLLTVMLISAGTVHADCIHTDALICVSPVYTFYSRYLQDFLWTGSYSEKEQLEKDFYYGIDTYEYLGIAGYVEASPTSSNLPVYRFWNPTTSDHFYTISLSEKEQLEQDLISGRDNYRYEGIAWYSPSWYGRPVYRFFDIYNLNHYYTSNEEERSLLQEAWLNGTSSWRYEGIAWYWYE